MEHLLEMQFLHAIGYRVQTFNDLMKATIETYREKTLLHEVLFTRARRRTLASLRVLGIAQHTSVRAPQCSHQTIEWLEFIAPYIQSRGNSIACRHDYQQLKAGATQITNIREKHSF